MKCILLGSGGREAIMAKELAKRYELYSVMAYVNPSIKDAVCKSGGKFLVGSPFDKKKVENFIRKEKIQLCVINNDNLLEAGLIDVAKKLGLKTFGPTKLGAKVEWSKEYSLRLVEKVAPEMAIRSYIVKSKHDVEKICNLFENNNFVVKPNGLTSGKGVKVGGIHFSTKTEGIDIAKEYLQKDKMVVIQEKIEGNEFTIMGFTDGKDLIIAPATYDYPYRYDNDKGPGTGGMGCFSCSHGMLPFLNKEDIDVCRNVMLKIVKEINKYDIEFNGVLNGGFFKTCSGDIKFMEFNSRIGDPEALNILSVMDTPFCDVVHKIAFEKKLSREDCTFKKLNSYVVYIVSEDYAESEVTNIIEFELDVSKLNEKVASLYFSNVEKVAGNVYRTVGNSRLMAFVSIGENMADIKKGMDNLIKDMITDDKLNYRKDIASIVIE